MSTEDDDLERRHEFDFAIGDVLKSDRSYTLAQAPGRAASETPIPIGDGGSGQVFKVIDAGLNVPFAIKLLNPATEFVSGDHSGEFWENFETEVAMLSDLRHHRVARILDKGNVEDREGNEIPFFVMEYIEGAPLKSVLSSDQLSAKTFLTIIDQVIEGVSYLHGRGILHCDLKAANILVENPDTHPNTTIVDLGVAKVVKPELSDEVGSLAKPKSPDAETGSLFDEDDRTYFVSSESITRTKWQSQLNKMVPRRFIEEIFPDHDLYAIGVICETALSRPELRSELEIELGHTGLQALESIKFRLLGEDDLYEGIAEFREDWEKLRPAYLSPVGIPELAVGAQASTSIATPSGRVSLTRRALTVINHPLMQRLRMIPQLELVSLVYPGATHTRLLHSLTTFDNARRFVLHLLRDPSFRLLVDQSEIEALLFNCLCHDIGHYPLSHMFEDLSQEQRKKHKPKYLVPTDDDLFLSLVDPDREVKPEHQSLRDGLVAAVEEELDSNYENFANQMFGNECFGDQVRTTLPGLLEGRDPSTRVLRGIVDSPIDVDKLSYLTDDSLMTGVRYGLGIDTDALLGALRAPSPRDIAQHESGPLIALDDKGLPAAESVIFARYWMLRRVYWHHTNRATIAMAKYVIHKLLEEGTLTIAEYVSSNLFRSAVEALDDLSERFRKAFPDDQNPLVGITGPRREPYKRVLTFAQDDPFHRADKIYAQMKEEPWEAEQLVSRLAMDLFPKYLKHMDVQEGDVLVDVPSKEREIPSDSVLVYLRGREEEGEDIFDVSPVAGQVKASFGLHVRKARVFVHPRIRESLGDNLDKARQELEAAIRDEYLSRS